MHLVELVLPHHNEGAVDRLISQGDDYALVLAAIAEDYAEDITQTPGDEAAALDLFCKLIDAGFFEVSIEDEGDHARIAIRSWSPVEKKYKFSHEFSLTEMCVADGMQQYFTAVN